MPDQSYIRPGALILPKGDQARGTRYLSVDFATRRITNEFKFSDVSYSFQRNVAGEFSATLDLYDPSTKFLKPQETFIVVERRGVPFWCGFLWQPVRQGKTLTVAAQEVWSLFGHRHIRETQAFNNVDRAAIFRALVQYAQQGPAGNLYVTVGGELVGGDPLADYKLVWWENKTVAESCETLLAMNPGFTFRIEGEWQPGNKLGFRLVIDTVHPVPTKHRLLYGGNVDEYEWSPVSPSPNFIDGFGGFDSEAMIRRTAQNDEVLTRQPRIEGSIENRELLGDEGVQNLAVAQLKRLSGSPSQPSVQMRGGSDPELGTLKPGYQCEVLIRDGYVQVDGDFSVEKISVTVPNGAADVLGAEAVTLEFESTIDDASVSTS